MKIVFLEDISTSYLFVGLETTKTNMSAPSKRERVDFTPFSVAVNSKFVTHYLFVKQHKTREVCKLKPQEKTAFVINVPSYFNEGCMRTLFTRYGDIANVYFHDKPTSNVPNDAADSSKHFPDLEETAGTSYKVAFMVFKKKISLKKLLARDVETAHSLNLKDHDVVLGVRKWCLEYNESLVDAKELGEEVERYMSAYDAKVEEETRKAKETGATPDEEGWITVSRHSHKSVIPRTEVKSNKILKKEKKKHAQKALINFYSFQIRESKMEHLAQLRKKFQEDKAKIEALKASRKFRPI